MDKIKAAVERHLWRLVVEVAQLPRHLDALRNYFLLARGEMYQVSTAAAKKDGNRGMCAHWSFLLPERTLVTDVH